ncbi:HD domain-containing protein [Streptomyces sp. NPDC059534]|uniref:HD domain-containing protein n=1 Tax=Streptomyces sp. NPDC059534 TaxID=3346859 RepID=UPI003674ED2F
MKSLAEVDELAALAHAGQVDKAGAPYVEHVRAVAAALAPLGPHLAMAGLLHDVIEDTAWTADRLRADGIPDGVVAVVEAVTNRPGTPYEEKIRRIAENPDATLVKIADNAHNSRVDRAAALPPAQRERLAAKYRAARDVLWAAADPAHVAAILTRVNPGLLPEWEERHHERANREEEGDSGGR